MAKRKQAARVSQPTEEPEWVREANEHFRETGHYRPEDVRRVLGDPTEGLQIGPPNVAGLILNGRR